jgi:hypothetical protein
MKATMVGRLVIAVLTFASISAAFMWREARVGTGAAHNLPQECTVFAGLRSRYMARWGVR